ncbi:H-NS histone family protein [Burkholderia multivorans]|uniref:H-NS histone family protein n=1 Tax=Burkholderia multivorans TaxID=87883 RepID=UPI002018A8EA|nr:H-NS histone family protein [Burkholderia multivorans]MCO1384340.1 H-NS histone family protein [Burkholderia multivorans]MCO1400019.1 H-NS histone family protein [Burkholderia multivorans]UQO80930.1 H-NS histone family protein [Burkholderia multivorans]
MTSSKFSELIAQRDALNAQIEAMRAEERKSAVATIHELVELHQLHDVVTIGKSKKGKAVKAGKLPAKYRDPVSGKTWSGKGREPAWMQGKDRAAFVIA